MHAKIVYHMHAKTAYYMHAKHVHSYARQSQFLHINTTSFCFVCRTICMHFHETGLKSLRLVIVFQISFKEVFCAHQGCIYLINHQCTSYSKNHYFLSTVISYTISYITFSSCPTEVVTVYLPHKTQNVTFNIFLPHHLIKIRIGSQSDVITNSQ